MQRHTTFPAIDRQPIIKINPPLTAELKKQLYQIQVAAFLGTYANVTDAEIQLPPGMTREKKYANLLSNDLAEIEAGNMQLITVFHEDALMGFATCKNVKPRYPKLYVQGLFDQGRKLETFKNDVHISLLATRPVRDTLSTSSGFMRLGIGKLLINTVAKHFQEANYITLDARHVNKNGNQFYAHNGFEMVLGISFEGHDLAHFRGYEKSTVKQRKRV
jgi:GNAT superfamily N-acetyltransferase